MLYLEDYLEMIEHLPQELRDRFTDMREMDLSIHNNMDELEKRVKIFFNECKRHQNSEIPPTVEAEFQAIRKEYYKTLEDGDEKVQLANQMYDLVEKYLRRLDSELHKFKCELEADNKGITEVLEKRSLELDTPVPGGNISSQQKENRYDSISSGSVRYSRPRSEKRRDSSASLQQYAEKRQVVTPNLVETRHPAASQNSSAVSSNITYNLGHTLGAGPAIAAAASQAIAATQQMQQGRRTASLKASYEAINPSGHGHEFIGRELAGAAQTAIQAVQQDHANSRKKQKRWTGGAQAAQPAQAGPPAAAGVAEAAQAAAAQKAAETAAAEATYADWTDEPVDPNEPRYCLCNQVSYGDMVACDNQGCPTEWFHYSCVGITAPPKGKWYCPNCMSIKKRHRKN